MILSISNDTNVVENKNNLQYQNLSNERLTQIIYKFMGRSITKEEFNRALIKLREFL